MSIDSFSPILLTDTPLLGHFETSFPIQEGMLTLFLVIWLLYTNVVPGLLPEVKGASRQAPT